MYDRHCKMLHGNATVLDLHDLVPGEVSAPVELSPEPKPKPTADPEPEEKGEDNLDGIHL